MAPTTIQTPQALLAAAAAGDPVELEAVLTVFDALPAVDVEAMIGEWDGTIVRTGHRGEGRLAQLGWVGKTFRAPDDVDPIVGHDAAGERVANPVLGAASLRRVEYRGITTATMIYDGHPILDHFRALDADTVLGLMDAKGDDEPLAFLLRRV